ncbi:hemin-degrading factor [Marinobacter xestospongiae]|uniref:hemin-degrading factor n=1 Tax=Marinobacter xestospongiae TaxID=994319 RepID=UPI002002B260|nr:ChuX/HutX family heme-like substrate-binding protein [Marinobacter xestospongiae]MCK7565073.1 hemin-degrading factor [Marinobacter xestospongiae]
MAAMDTISEVPQAPIDHTLAQRWQALLAEQPNLRIRNAARELGVSELELLLCREAGSVTPLVADFGGLLKAMDPVGEVMILSRNEQVVHEVTAAFHDFKVGGSGAMGLAVGDIDVRVFFNNWHYGYRVLESGRGGTRESLQFFDGHGRAVHKIYRTDGTDAEAWEALVARFQADADTLPALAPVLNPAPAPQPRTPVAEVELAPLQADWAALKDVHHFHAMLKRNKVDRLTAVELMGPDWCRQLQTQPELAPSPLDLLLHQVQRSECPVMVFVGNPGIVQIFTGTVSNLRRTGPWMNVLDPGFNLHANTDGITAWWVTRRPSTDGTITSVEGYNADGELVITVFGKRKPGQAESEAWRAEVWALEEALCV